MLQGQIRESTGSRAMSLSDRLFLSMLGAWLLGYAYFNKGFAYLGLPPFYVDSALMVAAFTYLVVRPAWISIVLHEPIVLLLFAFQLWEGLCTVPYLPDYGLNALRDSVIWSYSLLVFPVAYLTWRKRLDAPLIRWYSKFMLWFPPWSVFGLVIVWFFLETVPRWPWGPHGGVPILLIKGGDVGVHLAGAMAFWVLFGSYATAGYLKRALFWMSWPIAFLLVSFQVRAAFLAVALALLAVMLNINVRRTRTLLSVAFVTLSIVVILAILDVKIETPLRPRAFSFRQLSTNVVSIFQKVEDSNGGVEGTKRWRLLWWRKILSYTFNGPYFFTGKGYGINLADEDGFQLSEDHSLRSPHSAHMTILARSGVPGLILWGALLLALLFKLWLSYLKWSRKKRAIDAGLRLWVLAYLIAFIVNASFDVYLEGPMGGIWFWSVVGFSVGLLVKDRYESFAGPYFLSAARR